MKVWIDVATGTWGEADTLVVVDLAYQADGLRELGELIDLLYNMTDSEIIEYGERNGRYIV